MVVKENQSGRVPVKRFLLKSLSLPIREEGLNFLMDILQRD